MTLIDLPYVHAYRSRGRLFYYYRRRGLRIRLRGEPGSAEFLAAYRAADAGAAKPTPDTDKPPEARNLVALIRSYHGSPEWRALATGSRRQYEKALRVIEAKHPTLSVRALERHHIKAIQRLYAMDGDTPTPGRSNRIINMLSILMGHAIDLGWRSDNPASRPKRLRVETEGHRAWTRAEIAQFLDHATPMWRLALMLALCTGQRSSDVVAMTWAAYDGAAIQVRQHKTGERLWLPCHPDLKTLLDATPRVALTILTRVDGQPYKPNHFQPRSGEVIRAAGLTGVVWHGLRTTAASWLAEAGCTDAEIMAITGHRTLAMVKHYRRGADQKRLASAAIGKMRGVRDE